MYSHITRRRFYIAQKDIDAGVRQNCGECPIALSIQRNLKTSLVSVGGIAIGIDGDRYAMSERGKHFVARFDMGLPVKPFHLYITPEKPVEDK